MEASHTDGAGVCGDIRCCIRANRLCYYLRERRYVQKFCELGLLRLAFRLRVAVAGRPVRQVVCDGDRLHSRTWRVLRIYCA